MLDFKTKTLNFRKQIASLPREDILDIIRAQDPDLIMQIDRIEWVFANMLTHLNWPDGTPVLGRRVTNEELALLVNEPFEYDEELAQLGLGLEAQRQIHIAKDPVTWAQHFLGVKPRIYQIFILRHPNRFRVLRIGRRAGKSFSMALLLLWYSYTTKRGRSLVIAPMQAQANLVYRTILELVEEAPIVSESIDRTVASPPAEINFKNGSSIKFFSSGMKNNSRSDATRGQEAHLIVLDELDYMGDEDLEAVLAMMTKTEENQPEKMLIGASTPSGKRGTFYNWCTGDRFTEFWFPSYILPFWDQETEELLREEHKTEMGYRHEVEADWGEIAEGVYLKKYIDMAVNYTEPWEYIPHLTSMKSKYVIGVDWDKYGAGTNIVVLELCGNDYEDPVFRGKVRVAYREETTKEEYSLMKAVDRLVELNANFKPEWIYIDRGYGDFQLEYLHKHGVDHPETKLHLKVKGFQFGQSIETRDPHTMQLTKKELKPFMVSNLKEMLERGKIVFPKTDDLIYDQLTHYIVSRSTSSGRAVFEMSKSDLGDHVHDALILACLAVTQNYDDLMKSNHAKHGYVVSNKTFLALGAAKKEETSKIAKNIETVHAPVQIRRAMTATGSKRSGMRPIRRKMF